MFGDKLKTEEDPPPETEVEEKPTPPPSNNVDFSVCALAVNAITVTKKIARIFFMIYFF